jgi:hypothetical protein
MRSDMAKVIVERPRFGSRLRDKDRKGRRRNLQRLGLDGLKRERVGTTQKSFNEHLGPLRRYLDDQVGRPWDEVNAEIRQHIRPDSMVQKHVLTHVDQYVETNVILIDGRPCHGTGRGYGLPLGAVGDWFIRSTPWYVCPKSGVLKRVDGRNSTKKARQARRKSASSTPPAVRVDRTHFCKVIDGRWCLVEVRPLSTTRLPDGSLSSWEIQRRDQRVQEALREFGARVEQVSHRPLSKREMEQMPVPIDLWKQRRWWTKPGPAR